MGCNAKTESYAYDFFDDIVNYINKANAAQHNDESLQNPIDCDSFYYTMQSYFDNKQIAVSVCKELAKLYKSLNTDKKELTNCNEYKKDCGFFNYWVNLRISKSIINGSQCIKYIYNGIDSQFTDGYFSYTNLDLIYDINKDELDKMNILYSLYEKHSKLDAITYDNPDKDKQSLYSHSTACCNDYNKAKYICNDDNKNNNHKFCAKLTDFESKYDALDRKVFVKGSDYYKNFIKLSECPNNKIITTAVTGTFVGLIPLLGVLYKFTPMGQVLRSKMGILNKDISNNDEEMINMSLMDHENEQIPFQKGTYNIKYQSL